MKRLKMLLGCAAAVTLTLLSGCSSARKADSLKVVSSKTYELGDEISLNAADYLLDSAPEDVLEQITVDSDLKTDEKYAYNGFKETVTDAGKDQLSIGSYSLTLNYQGEKYPVTVIVRDTVMPEFVSPSAVVTVPVGETDFDFSRVYRTSDKDEVELRVEGVYDLKKEGTYPVTLIATDKSGNTNSLEITINVVGKNKPITASDQFDDEVVPSEEEDSEEQSSEESVPEDNGSNDTDTPEAPETPNQPSKPSACTIPSAPSGSEVYYNFSDLYAAGTAWNRQSPNNYFYYLEGTDDCGNKVYFLTKGVSDTPLTPPAGDGTDTGNTDGTAGLNAAQP